MDNCIFCKIVAGEIPADKLLENRDCIMIKDRNPVAPHHLLVIVKDHFDNIAGLNGKSDECFYYENVFQIIHEYVEKNGLDVSGYRILVNTGKDAGQTVNHLHFHLIGGATLKNDFGA